MDRLASYTTDELKLCYSEHRQSHLRNSLLENAFSDKFKNYIRFFITQCLVNALTLICFAVQAFGEHKHCIVEGNRDITLHFTLLFQIGFTLHGAVFVLQTYILPCFRLQGILFGRNLQGRNSLGLNSEQANKGDDLTKSVEPTLMSIILTTVEWVLHSSILLMSILMFTLVKSRGAEMCIVRDEKALAIEGFWLLTLAIMQVLKLVLFIPLGQKYGEHTVDASYSNLKGRGSIPTTSPLYLRSSIPTQDLRERTTTSYPRFDTESNGLTPIKWADVPDGDGQTTFSHPFNAYNTFSPQRRSLSSEKFIKSSHGSRSRNAAAKNSGQATVDSRWSSEKNIPLAPRSKLRRRRQQQAPRTYSK